MEGEQCLKMILPVDSNHSNMITTVGMMSLIFLLSRQQLARGS
jgi:hypothetical protein